MFIKKIIILFILSVFIFSDTYAMKNDTREHVKYKKSNLDKMQEGALLAKISDRIMVQCGENFTKENSSVQAAKRAVEILYRPKSLAYQQLQKQLIIFFNKEELKEIIRFFKRQEKVKTKMLYFLNMTEDDLCYCNDKKIQLNRFISKEIEQNKFESFKDILDSFGEKKKELMTSLKEINLEKINQLIEDEKIKKLIKLLEMEDEMDRNIFSQKNKNIIKNIIKIFELKKEEKIIPYFLRKNEKINFLKESHIKKMILFFREKMTHKFLSLFKKETVGNIFEPFKLQDKNFISRTEEINNIIDFINENKVFIMFFENDKVEKMIHFFLETKDKKIINILKAEKNKIEKEIKPIIRILQQKTKNVKKVLSFYAEDIAKKLKLRHI